MTPTERYGQTLLSPDSADELSRLTALERMSDDDTIRCLEKIGIAPGARCLEIGAGAGSVATWLAGVVGPANVTATDVDTRFLVPLTHMGVNVVRHDLVTDPAPGGGRFDLIHIRHVLEHLPGRDGLVRGLASWLSDGGWLVVEAGFHTGALIPRQPGATPNTGPAGCPKMTLATVVLRRTRDGCDRGHDADVVRLGVSLETQTGQQVAEGFFDHDADLDLGPLEMRSDLLTVSTSMPRGADMHAKE